MGGCSVLMLLSLLTAVGLVLFSVFMGAVGLFIIATVVSIVFAVRTPRRRERGKKLGALIAIPLVLYAVSIPLLVYFAVKWIPLVMAG